MPERTHVVLTSVCGCCTSSSSVTWPLQVLVSFVYFLLKKCLIKNCQKKKKKELPHLWNCWDSAFESFSDLHEVQFSCVQLFCDPMDCCMPGLPVHYQLPEFTQTHLHWVGDAIQPSHHVIPFLLLLLSIFPSIRVFSNESVLHIQ